MSASLISMRDIKRQFSIESCDGMVAYFVEYYLFVDTPLTDLAVKQCHYSTTSDGCSISTFKGFDELSLMARKINNSPGMDRFSHNPTKNAGYGDYLYTGRITFMKQPV